MAGGYSRLQDGPIALDDDVVTEANPHGVFIVPGHVEPEFDRRQAVEPDHRYEDRRRQLVDDSTGVVGVLAERSLDQRPPEVEAVDDARRQCQIVVSGLPTLASNRQTSSVAAKQQRAAPPPTSTHEATKHRMLELLETSKHACSIGRSGPAVETSNDPLPAIQPAMPTGHRSPSPTAVDPPRNVAQCATWCDARIHDRRSQCVRDPPQRVDNDARVVRWPWQALYVTSWILDIPGELNPEQRAVAEGLASILERLNPPHLDTAGSSAIADGDGLHVTLQHSTRPELGILVNASGDGEITVSYGEEHEHFRSEDAEVGRVWPFPSNDHVQATLTLVECLLTGRIELHVWKRPLGVKTRSYWINKDGQPELFLRGGTFGTYLGWARRPTIYRFDFTRPGPSP